jgi:peptidoglycan/xylan/chitin deacetylase (PgdA/CDA1 family)
VTHGPRDSKTVALTLDDGPNPPYTERFLELLDREKIPATFFVLGRRVEWHPSLLKRIADAGHELGNHGYSHHSLSALPPWRVSEEIRRTDALIRASGYTAAIPFRAPFGERFGVHAWVLLLQGRKNLLYDVGPHPPDYFRADPQSMADSAERRARGGSIILFHDGEGMRTESLEAVARLIPRLKAAGFTFVKLSHWGLGQTGSPP